jgi:DNA-binding NarL/FixJ family response regulator
VGSSMRRFDSTSVLVADGDESDRALIAALLEQIGCVTHHAGDGAQALALAHSTRPNAVILDVELPGLNGYEVCNELRASFGDTLPVVLVSRTRVESLDRVAGFLIGADEYIVKPFDPDEMLVRVRSLLRRNGHGADGHTRVANGDARLTGERALTAREREVLGLLAGGRNQREIAKELVVTSKTVATHIQRVLAKLGVHSRAEAVAYAHRHGLTVGADKHDFEAHALPDSAAVDKMPGTAK